MGIDMMHGMQCNTVKSTQSDCLPTAETCQPFYDTMREYNMVLLVHVGYEHTLNAGGLEQYLGSPLFLKGFADCFFFFRYNLSLLYQTT